MRFSIDWIEGTILGRDVPEVVSECQKEFGAWVELPGKQLGYDHVALTSFGARVYWCDAIPDMGVHISFPSLSLGLWGESIRGLIIRLYQMGLRSSRLDLAFDDCEGLLDLSVIESHLDDGAVSTHFRKKTVLRSADSDGRWGKTIAFGKRGGSSFVRIYDKAAEKHLPGHWVRVELELRKKRAALAFELLFQLAEGDWASQAAEWLYGVLDFKMRSDDTNKSRWDSEGFWLDFLKVARKARLTIPESVKTIEDLKRWVIKQVAPTLLVLYMAVGEAELMRIIGSASNRLRPKHEILLRSAGVSPSV